MLHPATLLVLVLVLVINTAAGYESPTMEQALPTTLFQDYSGPAPPDNVKVLPFHWVILSHERKHWGRTFTTTLLSGLYNELKPATTSVVWNNRSSIPSLLYNMRHSHSLHIFFPNDILKTVPELDNRETMHLTALLVPKALGQPELPMLLVQDDVTFAPDANARLSMAVNMITAQAQDHPYLLFLYKPSGYTFMTPEEEHGLQQPADDKMNATYAHNYTDFQLWHPDLQSFYGAQGYLYSAEMANMMLNEAWKLVDRHKVASDKRNSTYDHLGHDLIVQTYLERFRCVQDNASCHYYMMVPSLVQHTGMTSAIQANVDGRNTRFHMSDMYPVRIRLPGYEQQAW